MAVLNSLLDVLVCPACKGPLQQVRQSGGEPEAAPVDANRPLQALDCSSCRLRYPVVEEIPVMLIDQATRIPA